MLKSIVKKGEWLLVVIRQFKTGVTMLFNLVTKRAHVHADGHMEWIDGNIGSKYQYESILLVYWVKEPKGTQLVLHFAGVGQVARCRS